jgi:hypothetical protein
VAATVQNGMIGEMGGASATNAMLLGRLKIMSDDVQTQTFPLTISVDLLAALIETDQGRRLTTNQIIEDILRNYVADYDAAKNPPCPDNYCDEAEIEEGLEFLDYDDFTDAY